MYGDFSLYSFPCPLPSLSIVNVKENRYQKANFGTKIKALGYSNI